MHGWSVVGGLITNLLAQSSLTEALDYTNMAIAVCGAVAGLLAISDLKRGEGGQESMKSLDVSAEKCQSLAEKARFAESRARLLRLAERLH